MWYERRGIGREIKGDYGSFPCIRNYGSRLDVAKKLLLGKKCVCDIGEKGGKYGNRMYSYYCN
jgi:hypothetical protein